MEKDQILTLKQLTDYNAAKCISTKIDVQNLHIPHSLVYILHKDTYNVYCIVKSQILIQFVLKSWQSWQPVSPPNFRT